MRVSMREEEKVAASTRLIIPGRCIAGGGEFRGSRYAADALLARLAGARLAVRARGRAGGRRERRYRSGKWIERGVGHDLSSAIAERSLERRRARAPWFR